MAAPVINLANYRPTSAVGNFALPSAKNNYIASVSSSPSAALNLNGVGRPQATGVTNTNVLPDYLRNGGTSNGATSPTPTSIVPATTTPPQASSASNPATTSGGGTLGTPAANAYIGSQLNPNNQLGATPPTSPPAAPPGSSAAALGTPPPSAPGTPAAPTAQPSTYDLAMKSYLASLANSQNIGAQVQKQTLDANHQYQSDLDTPGGLLEGNRATAALDARRNNASLADLGVAQTAATNAENLDFQRLQYEKGALPNNDPYTLSQGQTRFDAKGNKVASLPSDGSSQPNSVQEYQFAQKQGYTGTFDQWKNQGGTDRVLNPTEAQSLGVPFGTTAAQAYGITPNKPLTESQAKDVTYGQRGQQAESVIDQMQNTVAGYNPGLYATYAAIEPNSVGNSLVPDSIRQVRQAERNFSTAILRRESGAAISSSEFDTVEKQYFPRPGDDAKTLEQKAQNRKTAIDSFLQNAGSASGNHGGSGANAGVVQSAIGPINTNW